MHFQCRVHADQVVVQKLRTFKNNETQVVLY